MAHPEGVSSSLHHGPVRTSLKRRVSVTAMKATLSKSLLLLRRVSRQLMHDQIYRNSILIMASTVLTSVLGFIFWVISARLYSSEDVGLATTMISSIGLLSTVSLLGYNTSLIRYMYASNNRTERISTSMTVVCSASVVISATFVILLPHISPRLVFVRDSLWLSSVFIITAVLMTSYLMLDSIAIALQRSEILLLKNSVLSVTKLAVVVILTTLGATGIFLANTLATGIAVTIAVLSVASILGHGIRPHFDRDMAREMSRYSWMNYAATSIESASVFLLPIIITNVLGPSLSGYFYIDMMIAGAIYMIPISVSQSVFAHGSRHGSQLVSAVRKATRLIAVLLVPAMVVAIVFGIDVLNVFGKEYATSGYVTLVLLVCASVPVAAKLLVNAVFNVEHKVALIITMNACTAGVVIGLSLVLMRYGLVGVGVAWLAGETIGAIVALMLLLLGGREVTLGSRGVMLGTVGHADVRQADETRSQ